jgi:ABC-type uncharacterized transport system auxiliary subunit
MRSTLAALAAAALLAGCVSLSLGNSDTPALTYYVLADARPAVQTAAPQAPAPRLAIQGTNVYPLADSISIVFSRQPGERSLYQFASWSERPSRRLAQLAQQRLQAGGRFASVTQLGQPVASDLLLTLALETMVHDVSSVPGRARITLHAELIDRRDRSLVASRRFSAAPPVDEPAAAAAVTAFGLATADVLDALTRWVEATAAAQPAR